MQGVAHKCRSEYVEVAILHSLWNVVGRRIGGYLLRHILHKWGVRSCPWQPH
jgi:hypothetical protein